MSAINQDAEKLAKHFEYLDRLRESGATNMYGASPYLERRFGLASREAIAVLGAWMGTFSDQTPTERAKAALLPPSQDASS